MVMGIPMVDFLLSQKSTKGSAYEAVGELIPSLLIHREDARRQQSQIFKTTCVVYNYIEEEVV